MSNLTCEEVRELAPEVALGIAGGEERARVLEHLAGCVGCRSLAAELAEVAGSMLFLIPPKEPPAGFENRALARMRSGPHKRRRWTAAAVAAALSAAITVGAVLAVTRADRDLAAHYRATLAAADGKDFAAASLRGTAGETGHVFAYEGSPSWIFVSVRAPAGEGRVDVLVVLRDGTTENIGRMRLQAGFGNWGGASSMSLDQLRAVRLVDESGNKVFDALFGKA